MTDIIIPVYNGLEDLKICLSSIEKYTDLTKYRPVIIDDKSPNKDVLPFLEEWCKNHPTALLIKNAENKGFSHNVNKGFDAGDGDVILLNTDTILTEGWAEKITECAKSRDEAGIVCPLSNNATLCSVPDFCMANTLPEKMTVDEMAQLVETVSAKMYPEIPVAVGFCMYIKREVINIVGYFDEETFGRGYGEENDFCHRAQQYGYVALLCDNAYVYHTGTVSFQQKEKFALIQAHQAIIDERYPKQSKAVSEFVRDNPISEIHSRIKTAMALKQHNNGKQNLLFVSHADFADDAIGNKGGVQTHLENLIKEIKDRFNIVLLVRDGSDLRVTLHTNELSTVFKFKSDFPMFPRMHDTSISNITVRIFDTFGIDLVHIHHLLNMSSDAVYLANKRGIPVYMTLHDYYYICPNIKLLDLDNKICTGRETPEMCAKCLKKGFSGASLGYDWLKRWREHCTELFDCCERIFAPSQKAKQVYLNYYPQLESKIEVVEHGSSLDENTQMRETSIDTSNINGAKLEVENKNIQQLYDGRIAITADIKNNGYKKEDTDKYILEVFGGGIKKQYISEKQEVSQTSETEIKEHLFFACTYDFNGKEANCRIIKKNDDSTVSASEKWKLPANKAPKKKTLNVAFIGGHCVEKGSEIIYKLINEMPQDYNFFIFGELGDKKLINLEKENVIKTDSYTAKALPSLLKSYDIDLVCIFSLCDETFCYTLSEAVLCDLPVITTDVGAMPERVKRDNLGWIVPVDSAEEKAKEILLELGGDKALLQKQKDIVSGAHIRTQPEMAKIYADYYTNRLSNKKENSSTALDLSFWVESHMYYKKQNGAKANVNVQELRKLHERLHKSQIKLDEINRAKSYRMLVKINSILAKFKK